MTVHNTKTIPVSFIKIVDQIPVSENSAINVKLVNPGLKLPASGTGLGPSEDTGSGSGSGTGTLKITSSATKNSKAETGSSHPHSKAAPISLAEVVASSAGPNVKVSNGIIIQWDGADDPESVDMDALGKDGKVNWFCEVSAGEKVNLSLQWEVSVPAKMRVTGL